MLKKLLSGLLLVGLTALAIASLKSQTEPVNDVMQLKLIQAHKLLDAVVLADFETVSSSAEELLRLSESALWSNASTTPEFTHYTREFRKACETLAQAAADRDSTDVALGYVEVTMACLECHQNARGVTRASRSSSP